MFNRETVRGVYEYITRLPESLLPPVVHLPTLYSNVLFYMFGLIYRHVPILFLGMDPWYEQSKLILQYKDEQYKGTLTFVKSEVDLS